MHELKLEFKRSQFNVKSSFMEQGVRLYTTDTIMMIDKIYKLLK